MQCLSTINMVLSDEDKILIKSLYLKGYTAKRLTDEFPEKSWTKHGVTKLFKKLRDTGTVNRRPGNGRPAVPTMKKTLSFFTSSRSLPLTLFCWLSDEVTENTFLSVKKTKSVSYCGNFWVLKQKYSSLHASITVRVYLLLYTAPLETFQMHVLTNNPGHIRPMNKTYPSPAISHGQSCGSAACPLDSGLNH